MTRSDFAIAVDAVQAALKPFLKTEGFRVRGRSFNRETSDGLAQVISIQMGPSDPPGTTYIPGLRENLHGLFTVNLGVYVPEVARLQGGGEAKSWVQEYHCCVRSRLGEVGPEAREQWWPASDDRRITEDLLARIRRDGLPFLERFSTRDKILSEWRDRTENLGASHPPRIVMAIICATRGDVDQAARLLALQLLETRNPGHPEYVRQLAAKLGVSIDFGKSSAG